MATATATIDIPARAEQVWRLIGGFDSLPDWLPYIPKCELSEGGLVRRLRNPNGDVIVERLVAFDHAARSYTYAVLEAPFPVRDYLATLSVTEIRGGTAARVVWSGSFLPQGVSEQEATRLLQGIYQGGLRALAEGIAARLKRP